MCVCVCVCVCVVCVCVCVCVTFSHTFLDDHGKRYALEIHSWSTTYITTLVDLRDLSAVWAIGESVIRRLSNIGVYYCNLISLQPLFFFSHAFLFRPSLFRLFSNEHWRINKPKIFSPVEKKLFINTWKCMEITPCCSYKFLRGEEVKYNSRRGRPSTSKTELGNQSSERVRQPVWWLLIDCSNDCKSAGYKKGECLEDYHRRFGRLKSTATGCLEHSAVPIREEYRRIGKTSQFLWSCPEYFFLFRNLKGIYQRIRFEDMEAIKGALTTELRGNSRRIFTVMHRSVAEKEW